MKISQILASLIQTLWLLAYWKFCNSGGYMTGFGPSGPGDPTSPVKINFVQLAIDIGVVLLCIIPTISLWTPYPKLIEASGWFMLAFVGISVWVMLIFFPIGFPMFVSALIWYYAAAASFAKLRSIPF